MIFHRVLGLALFLAATGMVSAADDAKSLTLTDLPAAVQKTITGQIADGQLGDIDKTNEGRETVFDVSYTPKGGEERDLTVADDGTLLTLEVGLTELPAAVQATIQTQASGSNLESVEKNLDDAEVTYDVEVSKDGKDRSFTVAADGDLLSEEVSLTTTPAAVQSAVSAKIGEGTFQSIDESFEPEGNSFDVEALSKDGAHISFSVSATGELLTEEVALSKVPPAARKTIQTKIGDGKIIKINKSLSEKKDGVLPYEVQGRKDGKAYDFSVGPKGRFLGLDQ